MKEVNLVIVESPAKAKTIEKFLGKDFIVKSSFGHIRDLAKKNLGIDIENNYKPDYIVPTDKKKVVDELKKLAKSASIVWLASDEDREGEAIAWHLYEVLKLSPEKTRRIVFHEITKEAILKAVENPRFIDLDLVNAQQARRILDRLVGFEISPILWKKIKPALSAGRVQSVAVKLIVEREREIGNFVSVSSYRIIGHFKSLKEIIPVQNLSAELNRRISQDAEVIGLLETFRDADFQVADIKKKPTKKSPSPPFITSTLQQEASRKLGFSVSQTMAVAQRLYEAGKITYMRTDSLNLADSALAASAEAIKNIYGEKYLNTRKFKTKAKGAQEAHEAIRPSYMNQPTVEGSRQEQKLYELIWKRTIASQMSDALLEKTTIDIQNNKNSEVFVATGEVLKFDGFLKVYFESKDDENDEENKALLPALKVSQNLDMEKICAEQKFTNSPPRYTEASLVKKLEELGIGRPSTYAPTISTVQNRGYVIKEDRDGKTRDTKEIKLIDGKIKTTTKKEKFGFEKSKIFPTDIGLIVNDFLEQHFQNIMDYNFTASVEAEFDNIAEGTKVWTTMLDRFYKPFHSVVTKTEEVSERARGERILGTDPKSGKPLLVKIGRYGPIAQIGEVSEEEKPKFASLLKGQSIETITLEEALELFKLPRTIGEYEDKEIVIGVGRFGPYVRHNSKFYSLKKGIDDPMSIEAERAIELIEEKRLQDKNKYIKTFEEMPGLEILNGRFGPYITYEKKNFKIPKGKKPEELSLEDCKEIMKNTVKKKK
ncbi:MAG: type I DNA topoisomerase [Bacteroidales bacterium]|nr:type I DNA topoisomerase [Bacteroidales bacterium]MCF8389206.1 type I DNA topoisomerase [Bacteroidales bacterium]